jgi:hypothetical protein
MKDENEFDIVIDGLLAVGKPLSSIINEFASSIGRYDDETAEIIGEVADVLRETEVSEVTEDE